MSKRLRQKNQALARFMAYILGHSPHEFGLVPDSDGFVPIKELLQVLHEEEGWRHIRQSHINEVLAGPERALFHCDEKRIMAVEKKWEFPVESISTPEAKIYFIAIRRRAHGHVMEKGLSAPPDNFLVLSPDRNSALRIGKRKDPQPVVLEVKVHLACAKGIKFFQFGELLLCRELGPQYLSGPPVKEQERKARSKPPSIGDRLAQGLQAGTFELDAEKIFPSPGGRRKGRKPKGWKEERRKMRRKR